MDKAAPVAGNTPLKVTANLIRLEQAGRLLLLNSLQPRPLLFRRGREFVDALLASAVCGLLSATSLLRCGRLKLPSSIF